VIKLTRLNRSMVAINPDHISWVDVNPDTTLCLIGGEKIIVRESLEELIDAVVTFRRLVRAGLPEGVFEGDPPSFADAARLRNVTRRSGRPDARTSAHPSSRYPNLPASGSNGSDR
jgi:flagellar protein FlbD